MTDMCVCMEDGWTDVGVVSGMWPVAGRGRWDMAGGTLHCFPQPWRPVGSLVDALGSAQEVLLRPSATYVHAHLLDPDGGLILSCSRRVVGMCIKAGGRSSLSLSICACMASASGRMVADRWLVAGGQWDVVFWLCDVVGGTLQSGHCSRWDGADGALQMGHCRWDGIGGSWQVGCGGGT